MSEYVARCATCHAEAEATSLFVTLFFQHIVETIIELKHFCELPGAIGRAKTAE